MRNVVYSYNASLDGFIEGTDGDFGWSVPDEELHRYFNDLEHTFDVHLYGWRMYEGMQGFWPTADKNESHPDYVREYALLWQKVNKVVFSRTMDQADGARVVKDNIAAEIAALKEQPGKNMSLGGATLAASFQELGLIDEYMVFVHPILLGGGKPMFMPAGKQTGLKLVEVRHFNSGVVLLHYRRG